MVAKKLGKLQEKSRQTDHLKRLFTVVKKGYLVPTIKNCQKIQYIMYSFDSFFINFCFCDSFIHPSINSVTVLSKDDTPLLTILANCLPN